jgi:phage tail-like protein
MTTPIASRRRPPAATNGAGPPAPPNGHITGAPGPRWPDAPLGVPDTRSTYLEYLPGIYQDSEFLARFLLIFEHIFSPIARTSGSTWVYFDVNHTPNEFLPWLGSWIGLVLDARVPEENRREIIRQAPELYRWRGTRRGLRHFLHLFTGIEPEIIEPSLGEIAGNRNLAYRFTVRFRVPAGRELSRAYLEQLVEAEKPAFAAATIEVVGE